jgi:hypothetical protein
LNSWLDKPVLPAPNLQAFLFYLIFEQEKNKFNQFCIVNIYLETIIGFGTDKGWVVKIISVVDFCEELNLDIQNIVKTK